MKDTTKVLSSAISFLEVEAAKEKFMLAATGLRFAQLMTLKETLHKKNYSDSERLKIFEETCDNMRDCLLQEIAINNGKESVESF